MLRVDENSENEQAIDAFIVVHNHLYLIEQSIRREIKRKMGYEFGHQREIDQQMECEIKPWDVAQREICYDFSRQRSILRLVCSRIFNYARRAVTTGYMDEETRTDIAARAVIRLRKDKNRARSSGETEDVDEQRPLKIHHRDLPIDPTPQTFLELAKSMDAVALDELHEKKVKELMVEDTKRKACVPSRFCSFHLAGFDLDAESITPLGPPYQPHPSQPGTWPNKYVDAKTKEELDMAHYSSEVICIRVVKDGPDCTCPVEVYGKVITRDQIDYKCVYLFNREREDAQTINSENDMLALSGLKRVLVTLDCMYFEFDLKIKGKGDPVDDKPFSKGVLPYFCNPDIKRVKYQLPSFQSTVKVVLQHVDLPVAASLKVSVVNQQPNDPVVHYDGKITAGTTRNYRHHVLLYDSIVRSRGLVRGDGSLGLYRNVVAVSGCVEDLQDEKLVLYVCFLDASCELEDVDKMNPEEEDDDDDFYVYEEEDKEEEKQEVDPKNVVTLKYPQSEAIWEHGSTKLKVKVDWTVVLNVPLNGDFRFRRNLLPDGRVPDYRYGIWFE